MDHEKVIVIDFGGQYNQLVASWETGTVIAKYAVVIKTGSYGSTSEKRRVPA